MIDSKLQDKEAAGMTFLCASGILISVLGASESTCFFLPTQITAIINILNWRSETTRQFSFLLPLKGA